MEQSREALGRDAVFSVRRAAELLPVRDAKGRKWLREKGLIRLIDGQEVVIWGDVLDALNVTQPTTRRAPRAPARRVPL